MKTKKNLFVLTLSLLLVFLVTSPVWAAKTTTWRVTYANSYGHVTSDYFKNNAKTVKNGTTITLPKYSKAGYKIYWVTFLNGKRYSYTPGQKVEVTKNVRFDLYRYKICEVKFFSANGKTEYKKLRKNVLEGNTVKMSSVSSNGYKFVGWSRKKGGAAEVKAGSSVKINNNTAYYAVFQKSYGIKLYKYNGTYWKTINNTSGTETFPILGTTDGMYLGWSREKGKHTLSSSDFKGGDKIPGDSGSYYPVKFLTSMDKAPSVLTKPKYDKVYFVGDSRTVGMQYAVGGRKSSNVNFIAMAGKGLNWLKDTGYNELIKSVSRCDKKETKAVVFNFGVNDLANITNYLQYMKEIAPTLRKYNCKLYYMSVNPVNSAMCSYRSEKNVENFNYYIRYNLCSGENAYYKYINCCSYLQYNGWISRDKVGGGYDGLHYSHNTYFRIYDYCIKNINK